MGSGCPRYRLSAEELQARKDEFRNRVAKKMVDLKEVIVDAVNKLTSACCPQNLENIMRFVVAKTKDDRRFEYSNGLGCNPDVEDFVVGEESVLLALNELIFEKKVRISMDSREFVFVRSRDRSNS